MRSYLAYTSDSGPWPGTPHEDKAEDALDDEKGRERAAAVVRIISLMGDTRRLIIGTASLLASDVVGIAIVASVILGRGAIVSVGSIGLLTPVILGWLVSALLMFQAENPVADVLGEIRRVTGAPVDPSAPWKSMGVRPWGDPDLDWDPAQFVGIVNLQHSRARLALLWAIIATAGCLLWTVLMLAIAAIS